MPDQNTGPRIPKSHRSEFEEIFARIDGFCAEKRRVVLPASGQVGVTTARGDAPGRALDLSTRR